MRTLGIEPSEKELVAACCQGDRRAQELVYKKYVTAMYNRIVRMVPNTYEAEDLVQECFVKVFKQMKTFRAEATLGSWIKRIAINLSISHLRKQRNFRWEEINDDQFISEEDNGSESIFDVTQIHAAIKTLPVGCRTVFTLVAIEGYPHKEVAYELGISESTSKTQYRRAKLLLRSKLASYATG